MLFKHFTNEVITYFFNLSFIFFGNCVFAIDDSMHQDRLKKMAGIGKNLME